MKQSKQQKRNELVLQRLIAFSNDSKESAKYLVEALDNMLIDLCQDDFFGTETQMEPPYADGGRSSASAHGGE